MKAFEIENFDRKYRIYDIKKSNAKANVKAIASINHGVINLLSFDSVRSENNWKRVLKMPSVALMLEAHKDRCGALRKSLIKAASMMLTNTNSVAKLKGHRKTPD